MANRDILTRTGVGSPLTQAQHDQNHNSFAHTIEQQSGATYTVVYTDQNKVIELDNGSMTVTLTAIATINGQIDTDGFQVTLKNINAADATVNRSGADTIDGATSVTLGQYESITLGVDSTGAIWNVLAVGRVTNDATLVTPTLTTPTITTPAITGGTVNGTTISNFVPLATPQLLVNSATINADTLMDMSVQYAQAATDGAVMAQCTGFISITNNAAAVAESELLCHSAAPGAPANQHRKVVCREEMTATPTADGLSSFNVALDANSDFYWRHRTNFGTTSPSCLIYLTGYWV